MSYNGRTNNLTGNVLSDEWYTPQFIVDKCIEIARRTAMYYKPKILLPYDTENSLFVKSLKDKDIIYGIRDFLESDYNYDVLITNPPFSLKEKIFEKCLKNGREFILVLPELSCLVLSFLTC